ncbi:MAG: SET domain-containing protein [Candidatus Saccharibacteria bacterium]
MIHIKYKLDRSELHGIGLFADEPLPKGALIYTESPVLDVNITGKQFEALSDKEQREIRWWGFKVPGEDLWHVDFDVSRFINHSYAPTVTQDKDHKEAYLIATRDLEPGEELTQNYLEFESAEDLKQRGIK